MMDNTRKMANGDDQPLPGQKVQYGPGSIIGGDYSLLHFVGKGGMGAVYTAEHRYMPGKIFALKILNDDALTEQNLKRFHREAQALAKLSHEGIVHVYNFGIDGDTTPYYVMELIEGESLADYVRRQGPLTESIALAEFKQVALALDYAHRHGIIHRDLKPSNLMLIRQNGETVPAVKVVDFGLVRLALDSSEERQQLTATGEVFGTPYYMSPEQAVGATVSNASDVYSLGCTMFESLTGAPPFRGENAFKTLYLHQYQEPPWLRQIAPSGQFSEGLEEMIYKMLSKNPAQRYQTMAQVAQDIERILAGKAIGIGARSNQAEYEQPEPVNDEPAAPEAGGRSVFLLLAVALSFLLLVGIAGYMIFIKKDPEVARSKSTYALDLAPKTASLSYDVKKNMIPGEVKFKNGLLQITPGVSEEQIKAKVGGQFVDSIEIRGSRTDSESTSLLNHLKSFKKVRVLLVDHMQFDEQTITYFNNLPQAQKLAVHNCKLPLETFSRLPICAKVSELELQSLTSGETQVESEQKEHVDRLLTELAPRDNLRVFRISQMEANPKAWEVFARRSRVKILYIGRNRISPAELKTLCAMNGLESLFIGDDFFTAAEVIDALKGKKTLKIFGLNETTVPSSKVKALQDDHKGFVDPSQVWSAADFATIRKLIAQLDILPRTYVYVPEIHLYQSLKQIYD